MIGGNTVDPLYLSVHGSTETVSELKLLCAVLQMLPITPPTSAKGMPFNKCNFFYIFHYRITVVLGVHCEIYKSSYNIS
jgi:hypothetical protein